MCRLLEAIRYENGRYDNVLFHRERMENARHRLFGINDEINLSHILAEAARKTLPKKNDGLFKCRLVYDRKIRDITFLPYRLPQIKSLQMVEDDNIDYTFKFADRRPLNRVFSLRAESDDVLIVKNGTVTDTSFCNVLFFNGKEWLTPEKPLLAGTRRAALLAEEKVKTAVIRPADLHYFSKVRLVNAMIRFDDALDIPVKNIRPLL
jgi:4-amino-4-deoxychorismate lyase